MNELDAINVLHISKVADIINMMKRMTGTDFESDLCSKEGNLVRGISGDKGIEINYNGENDTVIVSYYHNENGMWNKVASINTLPKAEFNGLYTYGDLIYHSQVTDRNGKEVDMFTYEGDTHNFFDSIRDKTISFDDLYAIEHKMSDVVLQNMPRDYLESSTYGGPRIGRIR